MLALLLLAAALPPDADRARLAALDRAVTAQERRLAAEEAPLAALLATAQRLALRPPLLTLTRPRSIIEMSHTRALIAALEPQIRLRTRELRRRMVMTQALRAELAQTMARRIDADEYAARAQIARTAARLAALPGPASGGEAAIRPADPPVYRLPAAGRVVVGSGERSDIGVRARGLTLATAPSAIVAAPAAARIAYAGPFRGYGDIVILDHGGGWTTLLAGLELTAVATGERVSAGAPVGHMARAAPLLTIELRHAGRPVDVAGMMLQ